MGIGDHAGGSESPSNFQSIVAMSPRSGALPAGRRETEENAVETAFERRPPSQVADGSGRYRVLQACEAR
jgi:hypothetical protein